MLECVELKIEDGLLAEHVMLNTDHQNKGGEDSLTNPEYIVMHYTAGPSLAGAIRSLTNPKRSASAHFIIDKNGEIAQLVETNRVAWHAGRSMYTKPDDGSQIQSLNRHSIGIEFVNAGKLSITKSRVRENVIYRTWWGAAVDDEDVFIDNDYFLPTKAWDRNKAIHKTGVAFERFTPEQIESGLALTYALKDACPSIIDVLSHAEVAMPEGRKIDPGPAFPLDHFRSLIKGRNDEDLA